jgi:FAD/FMN-containing dehydrogenase
VILSLERMRAVRAFDAVAGTMTVEAGAILADIHAAAEAEDLIFPLTLASQGSARIGGLLSTNAGGVNVLRYGNARDLCLGIEAVLPDGSVMNTLSGLRKNNMGYDLRHLLIGAEGTLGVITAATLRLFPKPATTGAALMVVPDPTRRWAFCGWRRRRWERGCRRSRSCTGWASISCARSGRRCATPSPSPAGMDVPDRPRDGRGRQPGGRAGDALCRGVRGKGSSPTASSPSPRRSGPSSGPCGRPSRWPTGGSGRSPRTTSPSPWPRSLASSRSAGRLAEIGDYRINCFGHLGDGNLHYNVFPVPGRSRADHEAERPAIKRAACMTWSMRWADRSLPSTGSGG